MFGPFFIWLKGVSHKSFDLYFFPWFEPIWAPDKQGKVFLNLVSIWLRYSITKFGKFDSALCITPRCAVWLWSVMHTAELDSAAGLVQYFAHLLIAHSLRSLKSNEWLWANRSDRSSQKRDREQIAQVAHDKWATASDLLRSLMINERMNESLVFSEQIAYSLFCSQQTSVSRKQFWLKSYFLVRLCMYFLRGIHLFPLCYWVMWVNCSGCSPKMSKWANCLFFWANRSFAHFFRKNKRFAQKND